jgi:hypothetical protein
MATFSEIAEILKTNEKNVTARIAGLKLGDVCGRCGGSGNYSYNAMHGTRCYGCGGSGQVLPKTLKGRIALAQRAREAVAAGKLEPYLEEVAARRRVQTAQTQMFAAWSEIFKTFPYNWMQAATETRENVSTLNRWRADQNAICAKASDVFLGLLRQYEFPAKGKERITALEVEKALADTLAVFAEVRARVEARGEG